MILDVLFGAYIPIAREGRLSENAPLWAVGLLGAGCMVTLLLMYGLIGKTRRKNLHQKGSAKGR
jgi:hypothetical protein